LLLVPDLSNRRVMAFDPVSGNLLEANFIPNDGHLTTPVQALYNPLRNSILVSDEGGDIVQEYSVGGEWIAPFVPSGGPNPSLLDNPRGLSFKPNGNVLVTAGGGSGFTPRVAEYTRFGSSVGVFIANTPGGLANPWSTLHRASDVLVSDSTADAIKRYGLDGAYLGEFAAVNTLPQQLAATGAGTVLAANSSGSDEGILEYNAAGTRIGRYDPTLPGGPGGGNLSNYRGVYPLGNGNLLATTNSGVYEINRTSSTVVSTKIANVSANFITKVDIPDYVGLEFNKTVGLGRTCADTAQITVDAGTTVTYCFALTNTGAISLTNHVVVDEDFGLLVSGLQRYVQPYSTLFFTRTAVVEQTSAFSATWTAGARGYRLSGSDTATVIVNGSQVPDVSVGPGSLQVTVAPGAETTRQISISNTGNAALSWTIAAESPAGSGACAASAFPQAQPLTTSGSTAAGQASNVTIRISGAGAPGAYSGALCVASNDPDEPAVRVPVTVTVSQALNRRTFLPLVRR
ncbi:MAG TPA: hypothetical protein VGE07_21700, partial [Herpetosiphonaceae bacterium]